MGKSVNSVTLLGHVGRAPEIRSTAKGALVANLSVATNERRKVGAEYKDHTEWHRLAAFGKLAEIIRDYVKKGSQVYVEGSLRTDSWDDNGTSRYSTSVVVKNLILVDGRPAGQSAPPPGSFDSYAEEAAGYGGQATDHQPITDEDIPF